MGCKNCEIMPVYHEGLCEGCMEEKQQELEESGFTCRHRSCDNPVKDENDICAECTQEMAEYFADMEKDFKAQQFAEGL